MKHEFHNSAGGPNQKRVISFSVFFFLFCFSYSQVSVTTDTVMNRPVIINRAETGFISVFPVALPIPHGYQLLPLQDRDRERTISFLDTLRTKASKRIITQRLYDIVIRPHGHINTETVHESDEENFGGFRGLKIRNIEIKRLNVFGTSIYDPELSTPNKIENILNKTHISTNEFIIRRYLLFHKGDTLSPLTMGDNERLLRNLPGIDDARIMVSQVSDEEADIVVVTKDIYSLGGRISLKGIERGSVAVFDNNIFGMGHEFGIEIPWDSRYSSSPGLGAYYQINNILKTFSNLNLHFNDGLGRNSYGFSLSRNLVSTDTRYAVGISIRRVSITEDHGLTELPAPVKYTLQNYWLQRSFLLNRESATRLIFGVRYTNNNVYDNPFIPPDSFHNYQKYKMLLGSVSYSTQRFYKANLIYSYGRTEDIPFGGSVKITGGREFNEFKDRTYFAGSASFGHSIGSLGYLRLSAGAGSFLNGHKTEQGVFSVNTNYYTRLLNIGTSRIRTFISAEYTRGFDRYADEKLFFTSRNGMSLFRNDSTSNAQRLTAGIESVLFSPFNFYGFRFAIFGFADAGVLFGLNEPVMKGDFVSVLGLGLRIRNDNLILNTFQIRIGFFPVVPDFSRTDLIRISGEHLLEQGNFEPGPPALLPYN
ncbi:MAG: hypothetical protein RBT38_02110 [Bacteroidales bacterium]|nr:hypothetical protein [Bacteroidales bacterium]